MPLQTFRQLYTGHKKTVLYHGIVDWSLWHRSWLFAWNKVILTRR